MLCYMGACVSQNRQLIVYDCHVSWSGRGTKLYTMCLLDDLWCDVRYKENIFLTVNTRVRPFYFAKR